jgi:hypothetical protein
VSDFADSTVGWYFVSDFPALVLDFFFSTARGGSAADAGSFALQVSLNGKFFQHYFLYTNLTLFNYYYRKCTCSTMAGLHSPRRQACRRRSSWASTLAAASTRCCASKAVAPSVEE